MNIRKLFPLVKSLFTDKNKIILRDKKIEEAKNAYEQGKKKESLSLYREVIGIDASCKPARYEIGKISGEIKEEQPQPRSPTNKAK